MITIQTPYEIRQEHEDEGIAPTEGECLAIFLERLRDAVAEHDAKLEAADV